MKEPLVLRSIYPEKPSPEVVLDFREHVSVTGQPETFPAISTEHPPSVGHVEALLHPVDINQRGTPIAIWRRAQFAARPVQST